MYATAVAQTREKMARGEAVHYSKDGKSIVPDYDVADALINRGKAYEEKKLRQKQRKEREELQMANTPKVNLTSEEMAARKGTTSERLLKKTGTVRPETIRQIEEEQPTFQPDLPGLQNDDERNNYYRGEGPGVVARSDAWLEAKAKRAKKAADTLRALEDAEWTFKPKVTPYGQGREPQAEDRSSPSRVVNRSMKWQAEKQRRLDAQRMEAHKAELDGYTFQPNLAKSFSTSPKHSPDGKGKPRATHFGREYEEPDDSGNESEYGGTELDDHHEDEQGYEYPEEYPQRKTSQHDLSRKESLFGDPRNAQRRASVQQSLEELDDFMAIETSVLHDKTTEISGMSAYTYNDDYSNESDEYYAEFDDHQEGSALSPRGAESGLPPGWLEFISGSGKKYYHNALTGVTSWDPPTANGGSATPAPVKSTMRQTSYSSIGSEHDDGPFTDERWMEGGAGSAGANASAVRWRR